MKNNKFLQISGLVGACIGGLSVCGYLVGQPDLYMWVGNSGMAFNSAILSILYGICLYIIGKKQ